MRVIARLRLAAVAAAAILVNDLAQAEPVIGFVRDTATQRYLYTEVHEFQKGPDGRVQTALTRYFDPQGREIGRKTLDYRTNRYVPLYRLDLPAQGYAEGVRNNVGAVVVFKRDGEREETETLPAATGLEAADSGFNHLLLDQLPRLLQGETVNFQLIAAGNTDRYRFRAQKAAELTVNQTPAVRLRVEPDSVLRWLVDPIDIVYDKQGTRLMSYRGVSNILDAQTGKVHKRVDITYGGPAPAEARWPQRPPAAP